MTNWKVPLFVIVITSLNNVAFGQEKWDLRQCVEYAWKNNISIKQKDIDARIAAVSFRQAKWQQYPTANLSNNTNLQFGRSIDPTTNQFTSVQLLSQSFAVNTGINVFNWNRMVYDITSARYQAEAAEADVEKIKNDIGLSVANYYLQVLLSRQQVEVAKVQLAQTLNQVQLTRKKVDAGAAPELDALTLEGQYATDSSTYITAQANANLNLLQLKGVLNVDAAAAFDVETPPVEQIPVEPILELLPENVFTIAMKNQPAQKANALRLKSMEAGVKSVRANFYPTIGFGAGLGTNFANILKGKSIEKVWEGWGTQMTDNFRQNIGLSISVPILNGGQAKFGYEKAKLNYKGAEITIEQANQTLKNDIYQAYYNATAALEKYNATQKAVATSQKTFDFASKRYELGLLNIFDLITSQNNLTKARYDMAYARVDYVFKMKVLEFYKGLGIRLN